MFVVVGAALCSTLTFKIYPLISVIDEEALYALTLQAFENCDRDHQIGLTWDEIAQCEEEFCAMLTIPCPTENDFKSFDENNDGNLTLEEYFQHVDMLKEMS